ncbi:MAG: glycosyltransferase [Rhodospirillales bacterium]|nr:glycosyltransferase [Rhodospirillales bacterium]
MRIALVTPCRNKAPYVEAALRSVLDQNYPDLDYGVIDGASTDGSLAVLERYRSRLSFLVSEPDNGMYDALAKGFARAEGEIMGYLGADDLLMPWALSVVSEIFSEFPEVEWLTSAYPLTADAEGRIIRARQLPPPRSRDFFRGANLPGQAWRSAGWIQQESTFWRRSLWERAGGLDPELNFAGDFDLWCRFFKLAEPLSIATPLAAFRRHGAQISSTQASAYAAEALAALKKHGGKPDGWIMSRVRDVFRRLGISRSGRSCAYDSAQGRWRHAGS